MDTPQIVRFLAIWPVVLVCAMSCVAQDNQFSNRTIKCGNGCLDIAVDGRSVHFQNNTSGFIGIWRAREMEQGWLIYCRTCEAAVNGNLEIKTFYLSYSLKKLESTETNNEETKFVSLLEEPLANSYWKLEVDPHNHHDFDCRIRPMSGDFKGWYLKAGTELGAKWEPIWKKKHTVVLVREKPGKSIQFLVDGL